MKKNKKKNCIKFYLKEEDKSSNYEQIIFLSFSTTSRPALTSAALAKVKTGLTSTLQGHNLMLALR